jgi:hypothetical protein
VFTLEKAETVTLYRPVGEKEMELIRDSDFYAFPPRLSFQPFFYPVLNESYATQIARDWNTKDAASGYIGYVTRFRIKTNFLANFEIQTVGKAALHEEYWIPAERLLELNENIVGKIEIISRFVGERYPELENKK